ncbi:hypothetical protein FACS1894218_1770 [Bacilli bacterium]|nr:hypothetical protein FACS1894218_1770 [Bacilli bacterium]
MNKDMKNIRFEHNYHTHTVYCHHAVNTVEEMIKAAIKNGFKTIGFSEHAPLLRHRNFRMNLDDVDVYINEVNQMKKKYAEKIKVLLGLETEYHKSQYRYYKDLRDRVDYLILGNHNCGNPHLAKE